MEDEVFWDSHINLEDTLKTQTEVEVDMLQNNKKEIPVDTQIKPKEDEPVVECFNNIEEIWSDLYKDEVTDNQVELEKVKNWAYITDERDTDRIGIDSKDVSYDPKMTIGSIRNSNASLDDISDLFSKEPRKDKQRKCNKDEKWQSKKER